MVLSNVNKIFSKDYSHRNKGFDHKNILSTGCHKVTLRCYIELGTVMERGSDGEGRREEKQERRKKIEEVERWMEEKEGGKKSR